MCSFAERDLWIVDPPAIGPDGVDEKESECASSEVALDGTAGNGEGALTNPTAAAAPLDGESAPLDGETAPLDGESGSTSISPSGTEHDVGGSGAKDTSGHSQFPLHLFDPDNESTWKGLVSRMRYLCLGVGSACRVRRMHPK